MVRASIPVSDLDRAERFYEDQLGLSALEARRESRVYASGAGTSLYVYKSPANAGRQAGPWPPGTCPTSSGSSTSCTPAAWRSSATTIPCWADEKGIHELGDGRVAWFKDPDGNTFALEE